MKVVVSSVFVILWNVEGNVTSRPRKRGHRAFSYCHRDTFPSTTQYSTTPPPPQYVFF